MGGERGAWIIGIDMGLCVIVDGGEMLWKYSMIMPFMFERVSHIYQFSRERRHRLTLAGFDIVVRRPLLWQAMRYIML